jgi:hypothetical protein
VKQRLKSFKTFESNSEFLSEDDIKDIFADLLDKGYNITFYDSRSGKYYFDLKLEDNSGFGKQRLESMEYLAGFEPEFSFGETSHFSVSCHIAHSSLD